MLIPIQPEHERAFEQEYLNYCKQLNEGLSEAEIKRSISLHRISYRFKD